MFVEKLLNLETRWKQQRQPSTNVECPVSIKEQSTLQNLSQLTQDYKSVLLAVKEVRGLGRSITEKKDSCDDKQHILALLLVNASDQE